jgi:histidyl-tRNA synthetase
MLGGGRYDNLTGMFSADPISGIGFGMGDVTMRDFLETHDLLTSSITAPTVMVIPMDATHNLAAQKIAMQIRQKEISVATDIGTRKLGKKISDAAERLVEYILVVGDNELASETYTLKNLIEETEVSGPIEKLIETITENQ